MAEKSAKTDGCYLHVQENCDSSVLQAYNGLNLGSAARLRLVLGNELEEPAYR